MGKFLFNPITGQLDQSGGSSLTLGTTAGTASEGNHTHAASDITSGTLDIARIPTGTSSTTVCIGNDSRLSDSRTPTAHAASHASAGSDPVSPASIGAQSIFQVTDAATNTGTLTASRAKIWNLSDFTNSSYNLKLPRTSAQVGDIVVIRVASNASWGANSQVTIGYDFEDTPGVPDFISLVTISQKGVQYRYQCTTSNSFGASYTLIDVDTHTHAAADVTSGVFDNARVNFAAPSAIGSTTPSTGAFTTLNANNGTLTASSPVLDLSQTWNNAAVTFTGFRANITDTASAAASVLASFQTGGVRQLAVTKTGDIQFKDNTGGGLTTNPVIFDFGNNQYWCHLRFAGTDRFTFQQNDVFTIRGGQLQIGTNFVRRESGKGLLEFNTGTTATEDGIVLSGQTTFASSNVAIRNGTNAQTFRIYNTTDAGLTNFERGFMRWSSNTLSIGTEAGGTGNGNRNIQLMTNGAVRMTVASEGIYVNTLLFQGNASVQGTFGNGIIRLVDWGGSSFDRLQFGGGTSSFPALKRSSTALQVRLADDSADAPFSSGAITTSGHFSPSATNSFDIGTSSVRFRWGYFFTGIALGSTSTGISSGSDGVIQLRNNNNADFGRLQFGGTTSSFPALKRSTTTIQVRLADDSGDAGLSCSTLTLSDNLTLGSGDNIVLSTTTGTQIGTATNQLLGFYGATPVDRPATVADPTGGGTIDAEARTAINDIIDRLQELGLIA